MKSLSIAGMSRNVMSVGVVTMLGGCLSASGQLLVNIDFGGGTNSAKVGYAATGFSTNDHWNRYRRQVPPRRVAANTLQSSDGVPTTISLTLSNAPGLWGNTIGDPMWDSFVYSENGNPIELNLRGVPKGNYRFALYGQAVSDEVVSSPSRFTLRSGTNEFRSVSASSSSATQIPRPYAVVGNVPVETGDVSLRVMPNQNGLAVLNGLQMVTLGTSPPRIRKHQASKAEATYTNLIVRSVAYNGVILDDTFELTALLEVESLTSNSVSVPLLAGPIAVMPQDIPAGIRVSRRDGDEIEEGGYRVHCSRIGVHKIQLRLIVGVTAEGAWNRSRFVGPAAAIANLSVAADSAVQLELLDHPTLGVTEQGDRTVLEGAIGADGVVALRWQDRTAKVSRRSLITVETATSARATPTAIELETRFDYDLLQARVGRLQVQIPLGQSVTRVQGDHIRDWNLDVITSGEFRTNLLTIDFAKPLEKECELTLLTEIGPVGDESDRILRVPLPLGVARETGQLSIGAEETTVAFSESQNLGQVNAIPGAVASYRFNARPIGIRVATAPIAPEITVADRITVRVEENRIAEDHELQIGIEKAGIYDLKLGVPAGCSVMAVSGANLDSWNVRNQTLEVNLDSRAIGEQSLTVKLERAVDATNLLVRINPLEFPDDWQSSARVGVSTAPGMRVRSDELENVREIPVSEISGKTRMSLAFDATSPEWLIALRAERLPSRVISEVFNLVTVGDGVVGGSAIVRYGLINQGVREFEVKLPQHWRNLDFTGANIRRREMVQSSASDTVTWRIQLQEKVWRGYTLVVTYDYPFDASGADLNLAGAHCENVERERGYLALTAAGGIKVQPRETTPPLRAIDPLELKKTDRGLIGRTILHAWQYTGSEFELTASAQRQTRERLLEAVADHTKLVTTLSPSGEMLTQASYMVKNNERQFHRFKLPADATFWGCYVDNDPVKAERDGEWLMVALPRHDNPNKSLAVELVYAQKLAEPEVGVLGSPLNLEAPETDVPNTYAEWDLWVPFDRKMDSFGGNMKVLQGTTYDFGDGWSRFSEFYGTAWRKAKGWLIGLAVVGGIITLIVLSHRRDQSRGLVTALVLIGVLAVLAGMLLPALGKAKAKASRIKSVNNLKQIALAAKIWASDHDDVYPESYEDMPDELGSPKILVDPQSRLQYIYVGAGKDESFPPDTILAYSPVDVHGRNVAFLDGSVSQMNSEQFAKALQRDVQIVMERAQAGKPAAIDAHMVAVAGGADVSSAGAMTKGRRSIRIDIPKTGQLITFTKLLNLAGEPLSLSMKMKSDRIHETILWLGQLLVFTVGLVAAWLESRRVAARNSLIAAGLALAAYAVLWKAVSARTLHILLIAGVPFLAMMVVALLRAGWLARTRSLAGQGAGAAMMLGMLLSPIGGGAATGTPTVVHAKYSGSIGEHSAKLSGHLSIEAVGTNQTFTLFGKGVAVKSLDVIKGEARVLREDGEVKLWIPRPANIDLEIDFLAELRGDVARRQIQFRIPHALASRLELVIPGRDTEVEMPGAISMKRERADGVVRVSGVIGATHQVHVIWTPQRKQLSEMDATVFVHNASAVSVGDGVVNVRSRLRYRVAQGELNQMRFRLPDGYRLLRVLGEGIRAWNTYEANGQQLVEVNLVSGVTNQYELTTELERSLGELPQDLNLVVPHVEGVRRETGVIGVSAATEVSLNFTSSENLRRTDVGEFVSAAGTELGEVDTAFRYFAPGFGLQCRADRAMPIMDALSLSELVVGHDEATLAARLEYHIRRAGVFEVRLALPSGWDVRSVLVASGGAAAANPPLIVPESYTPRWRLIGEDVQRILAIELRERTLGSLGVKLELQRSIERGMKQIVFPQLKPLGIDKLNSYLSATSTPGIVLDAHQFSALAEIAPRSIPVILGKRAGNSTEGESVLAFRAIDSASRVDQRLELGVEHLESWVKAKVLNLVSVTETLLLGQALVELDIGNAPLDEFRLSIPTNLQNIEIRGAHIRRRDQTGSVWQVGLQRKLFGRQSFVIDWELPRTGGALFSVPVVHVEGVDRETGQVVLLAKSPLQVKEERSDALVRIDPRELPASAGVASDGSRGGETVRLAYRYSRPVFALVATARRFEEEAVLQTLIERAQLTSVVADDGQLMTHVRMSVRNNGRQFLDVSLGTNASVWSAYVAENPVRPSRTDGGILLPLEESGEGGEAFAVEFTYVTVTGFPEKAGDVKLVSPGFGVPLKEAQWEFYLPPDYDYSEFAGTMRQEEVERKTLWKFSFDLYNSFESKRARKDRLLVVNNLKNVRGNIASGDVAEANSLLVKTYANPSGVFQQDALKKVVKDLNEAQAINIQRSQAEFERHHLNEGADGLPPADRDPINAERQAVQLQRAQEVEVAGVNPIRVNLPTRGERYVFSRVLQTDIREPMTVMFRAANEKHSSWLTRIFVALTIFGILWALVASGSLTKMWRSIARKPEAA